MPEMADAGKDHRYPSLIGGFDNLGIAHRTAGLNDGGGSRFDQSLEPVGKGEECV